MYIQRTLQPQVISALENGYVAIVFGARQVGKTTLAKEVSKNYPNYAYFNADDPVVAKQLTNKGTTELKGLIGNAPLVIIDEAQRIDNIGITLKLIHDTYPEIKLLATGSSSLDLANKIKEPLTGRSVELTLYPLSVDEISSNSIETEGVLAKALIYGGYPAIWQSPQPVAADMLRRLSTDYIYRDAFNPSTIFDQTTMNNLLRLLAYQLGNEVSYNELARYLEIDKNTVKRYINLLEKAFIIFRLNQFRRNQRSMVGNLRKVYFYDLGVRNGLIDAFDSTDFRPDIGSLWENFTILERAKSMQQHNIHAQTYYWRHKTGQEIDYIEVKSSDVHAYEFKWSPRKTVKAPRQFSTAYPDASFTVVTPENFLDFVIPNQKET